MPLPWLQILDAVIGVTDIVRSRKIRSMANDQEQQQQLLETGGARAPGALEARLAGVVVAALKEAFDRDARRIEFEREQAAAERERAERVLRLDLQRQAGDREIGRLRLVAASAVAIWIATLFLVSRVPAGGARLTLGIGWVLLGAAVAASFSGQSRVTSDLDALARDTGVPSHRAMSSGIAGAMTIWLALAGLALVGVAALSST
jgi:hypothetical protein